MVNLIKLITAAGAFAVGTCAVMTGYALSSFLMIVGIAVIIAGIVLVVHQVFYDHDFIIAGWRKALAPAIVGAVLLALWLMSKPFRSLL